MDVRPSDDAVSGTFGEQQRTSQTPAFAVALTRHARGTTLEPHGHSRATITVVLSGIYEEAFDGTWRKLAPLSLVAKPASCVHENRFQRAGALSLLIEVLDERWLDVAPSLFDGPRVFASVPAADLVVRILRELDRERSGAAFVIESLVTDWIDLAAAVDDGARTPTGDVPSWLCRVREYLHETPAAALSLRDVAREVGYHPVYVARVFRRHYRQSIGTYARRLRLERAARLLAAAPQLSISRIALDTGYHDHSHLSREFRGRTGVSPSRWRRLAAMR
jgi:AraC family transcriptional regulator